MGNSLLSPIRNYPLSSKTLIKIEVAPLVTAFQKLVQVLGVLYCPICSLILYTATGNLISSKGRLINSLCIEVLFFGSLGADSWIEVDILLRNFNSNGI